MTTSDTPDGEAPRAIELDLMVELDSEGRSVGVERETPNDEVIEEPFDPEEIDVATRTPTIDLLLSRLRRGGLDLQPDFQRLAGIWKPQAQSRLIESMLLRIPLPTFYASEVADEQWVVVDGIQRLTAIARFISPESIPAEAPLTLTGLEYLRQYDGKRFDQLPGRLQTRLLETEVVLHLIRSGTPEQVMFNIFARINTGGRPLTRQELRHALLPGPARDLLRRLAESNAYRGATLGTVSPARMDDREMVLRFLAFRMTSPSTYRRQDFDEFLREAMHNINQLDDGHIDRLEVDFIRAMHWAQRIFGEHAFRKYHYGQTRRSPINKALFEAISVNLAQLDNHALRTLSTRRELILNEISTLLDHVPFDRAISVGTGDVAKVHMRFAEIENMLTRCSQ
ncbi:GmrSD restriction endonuclease domain-containing protein [Actinophytocola glycyrrhizae]|uniref:DUF262 domain-containing protein n=1 Tax=Actinophytocola glycyrrhizae TaxID=2044873 RepID=A0ABV9S6A5_9PSEU